MRFKELKDLEHIPDKWPVLIVDECQRLHQVEKYLVAAEVGDVLLLVMGEEIVDV